jgi:hypothetical protein
LVIFSVLICGLSGFNSGGGSAEAIFCSASLRACCAGVNPRSSGVACAFPDSSARFLSRSIICAVRRISCSAMLELGSMAKARWNSISASSSLPSVRIFRPLST